LDATICNYQEAQESSIRLLKSDAVDAVLIQGPPGVGKTAMRHAIAEALGYQHQFMIKLSHHDVPDIAGVPVPIHDIKRSMFYPSADMLPPSDLTGGLLTTLDEIGDCNIAQQNLACQMVFERAIHSYTFPQGTKFLLTSNRVSDRSGSNRIVTKLGNRCAVMTLIPTVDNLFNYGSANGWNPVLLAFLKMHGAERINPEDKREHAPTYLNSFDPMAPDQINNPVFSSSRSLEFTSKYLNYVDANEPNLDPVILMRDTATMVGTPTGSKLSAFRRIAIHMPDPNAIAKDPDAVPMPKEEEVLWSLALTLVSRADKKNVINFAKYLKRGPKEYFVLFGRQCFDIRYQQTMPVLNQVLQDPLLKSILLAR
jgi:hypothetical protein